MLIGSLPTFSKEKHLDEKQHRYNGRDKETCTRILRDSIVEQETYYQYNGFDERVGEGADGRTWPSHKKMDTQGHPWFLQAENGGTIKLYDLRGAETLQLQATDQDLSLIPYTASELSRLLAIDSKTLNRTETTRDAGGHVLTRKFPIWFKDKKTLPTRRFEHDRWLNTTKEVDSFGHETLFKHNHYNEIIERIQPEVTVVETTADRIVRDEKGDLPRKRPVTRYGFNARGLRVGRTNANGHTKGVLLDSAGQRVAKVAVDGTFEERFVLSATGKTIVKINARGKQWRFEYDRLCNIIAEYWPINIDDRRYEYESGRRISDSDVAGNQTRYSYNARDNVSARYLPWGQCTQTLTDRNGQPIKIINPDGDWMSWERDYFGLPITHTDLAGRVYGYDYNFENQLTQQFLKSGSKWYSAEAVKTVDFLAEDPKREFPVVTFSHKSEETKSQDISSSYAYGQIESVLDNGINKLTTYGVDSEGHREQLEIVRPTDKVLLYRVKTKKDELGRETLTTDERLSASNFYSVTEYQEQYDAVSNVMNTRIAVTPASYSADCKIDSTVKDFWNSYYPDDLTKISGGTLSAEGQVQIALFQGFELSYAQGLRTREQMIDNRGIIDTVLTYNDNENIHQTHSPFLTVDRSFSVTGYADYCLETFGTQSANRRIRVNENGWQYQDISTDETGAIGITTINEFYACGLSSKETFRDERSGIEDRRKNDYLLSSGWAPSTVRATRTYQGITTPESVAEFTHDANITPNGKFNSDDEPNGGGELPVICFDTTTSGWLMDKQWILNRANRQTSYLYNLNGRILGGFTSGYRDALSSFTRPTLLYGLVNAHNLEEALRNNVIPYANGVLLVTAGGPTSAFYWIDHKLLRNSEGRIIRTQVPITIDDFRLLITCQEISVPHMLVLVVDRNACAWITDKFVDRALNVIGHSHASFMQLTHIAHHKTRIETDSQPEVSALVPYGIVHPFARTDRTPKGAKNDPLAWNDATSMQQLGPQTYIASPGDTFRGIASRLIGDASAAGKIASANGFASWIHAPKAGTILRIPQIIVSKNKAGMMRPEHNFMRVALGALSPPLVTPIPPPPPAPRRKKVPFWKMAVKVIAIAMVCVAAPHMAAALFPMVTGTFFIAATTGLIAAVGDAAVQALAIKIGAQDKFSVAEMLETGVSAGIGTSLKEGEIAYNTLKIATGAVAVQAAELAAGLRSRFDTQAILTQIAASTIATKINGSIDGVFGKGTSGAYAAKSIATPFSGAVIGSGITRTPIDLQNLAANAMGNAVGSSLDQALSGSDALRKIPDIEIDANDPRWHSGLSDIASKQRQTSQTKSSRSHDYLSESASVSRWRNSIFNGNGVSSSAPSAKSSTTTSKMWKTFSAGFMDAVKPPTVEDVKAIAQGVASFIDARTRVEMLEGLALSAATKLVSPSAQLHMLKSRAVAVYRDTSQGDLTSIGHAVGDAGTILAGGTVLKGTRTIGLFARKTIDKHSITKSAALLQGVLKTSKLTPGKPNQLEAVLADGTKIIFRRDINEYAHEIKRGTGIKVDHFNVEVQELRPKIGRYSTIENLHIVVDKSLKFFEAFTSKNGVLKDVPKLYDQSRP